MTKIDREELRALVRQALKEALGGATPVRAAPTAAGARSPKPTGAGPDLAARLRTAVGTKDAPAIPVPAGSGQDLARFVKAIAEVCGDAEIRAALIAGKVSFAPVAAAAAPASAAATVPVATRAYEMASGVLSEAKLVEIARSHGRINLGANVVLTPLARDKAREMRIELARQRP